MESIYKSCEFKITLNDKDISDLIVSIAYEDFESDQSDTLKIKIFPTITPKLKDKVRFYIDNHLIGSFSIASIAYTYKSSYECDCSSIDYSSNFRMRKNRSFDKLSYKQILQSIAKENNLTLKIDFKRMDEIVHIDQINQSDSSLCYHIAKELNLTQCIKNDTLIFLEKASEKKPSISLNASDCVSVSLQSYAKMFYQSVEVSYQNAQSNEGKTIKIGKSEPVLKRYLHSKSDDEAYKKAQGLFKSIQSNKKKGTLEIAGRLIYAGTLLKLSGDKELEGQYVINKVSHSIDSSGWRILVEFG
ncbi:contractile injection system protein, VgrG/Pvc8 family [Helicobacter sp. 13S00477-4]|uniref:phage late control D family protein n=1 Tax=Helicobacter sp. 13S00477-4 TaxID=1905759 RepID=UPI000BA6086D|nr:contractile injection system protein, VgrG/Pvc8 family [Helicobacter sp. 13S00477-4]PAF50871.1 hypothetical protein BKH44_06905 [Helicobacter sp. 13S00477-4]